MSYIKNTIILLLFIQATFQNLYSPHVYPQQGPYFEGWYSRFQDANSNISLGLLFGRVLPRPDTDLQNQKLAYISILLNKGDNSAIQNFDAFPTIDKIKVLNKDLSQITQDPPSDGTEIGFYWIADTFGSFESFSNYTQFEFSYDGISIKGRLGAPISWGPNGEGPAGFVDKFPLPLHWFVHSLKSPIEYLTFENKLTGDFININNGSAHQEKNWGNAFPSAWIWIQSLNEEENSQFVMSGGPLEIIGNLNVEAHLIGFRSNDLNLNFHPQDSIVSKTMDPCQGRLQAQIQNFEYKLVFDIQADKSSFTGLLGPSEVGFQLMCYESYNSKAELKIYKKSFLNEQLIKTIQYNNAALEFGGKYACNQDKQ